MLAWSALTATDYVLLLVSTLLSALRVYQLVRRKNERMSVPKSEVLGASFLLLSTVLVIIIFSLDRVQQHGREVHGGDGHELFDFQGTQISWRLLPKQEQINYVLTLLQPPALWAIKISYLCSFWGFATFLKPGSKAAIIIITVFMVVSYLVVLLIELLWCRPISRTWVYSETDVCFSYSIGALAPSSVTFAMSGTTDLAILLFGTHLIYSVRAEAKIKAGAIAFVAAIGSISLIASILRFYYNYKILTTTDPYVADVSSYQILFWMQIEVLFATTAYGLTTARGFIRPFIAKFRELQSYSARWKGIYGSHSRGSSGSRSGTLADGEDDKDDTKLVVLKAVEYDVSRDGKGNTSVEDPIGASGV